MAFTKTTGYNGYDVYTEQADNPGTYYYSGDVSFACGKKITGTMENTGTISGGGTTVLVQVSVDGTNYGTTAIASSAFTAKTTAGTVGFTIDLSTIYAPYVRLAYACTNHLGDIKFVLALPKGING